MDELVRVRRRLTRSQLDLADRVLGWLIVELTAIHQLERTSIEKETLRQLELLRRRLGVRDDS